MVRYNNDSVNFVFTREVIHLGFSFSIKIKFISPGKVRIRNRYNQAPHLTQDISGKVTTSQLDITNESQEVSRP